MSHLNYHEMSLLVDEMLPKKKAEEYHRHIASCPSCERVFDDLQEMSFSFVKLPEVEPPQGFDQFAQDILAQLPKQQETVGDTVVEIAEHRVKESYLASVDWKQWACGLVACGLLMWAVQPGEESLPAGVRGSSLESEQVTSPEINTMGEEASQEVTSRMDDSTMAMMQAPVSLVYWTEMGMELAIEQEEELYLIATNVGQGEEVLVFSQPPGDLMEQLSWSANAQAPSFAYAIGEYATVAEFLSLFPDIQVEEGTDFLLVSLR